LRILLLLFIIMPILEMWLLITVGGAIGALPTIGLVFLTAFIGLILLRIQGFSTLLRAREKMATNQVPAREMADGLFFAVGGALLLTPGFVTDAIGFACLTPGIRTLVIHFFSKHVFQSGRVNVYSASRQPNSRSGGKTIDGDFERHSD
jgi:UPF0716 protein FxsA